MFATDERSLPTCAATSFVLQPELVDEHLVGARFLDRVEILALDVFDQRHLEASLLLARVQLLDDDGDAMQARALRGAPAALAGDDLVPASLETTSDDRLNDAVGLDRVRQFLEALVLHVAARLIVIRLEEVDIDLQRRAHDDGGRRRVRNERAQSFS